MSALDDRAPDQAFPYQIREARYEGEARLSPRRDWMELIFVRGGSALYRDGEGEGLLRRGDVLAADARFPRAFLQAQGLRLCVIRFRTDALIPSDADLRQSPGFRALFLSGASLRRCPRPDGGWWYHLEAGLDAAVKAYQRQRPGYQTFLRGHLLAVAALLCGLCAEGEEAGPAPDGLSLALAYLEDHYTEEIALRELAEIAGISPRHLNRVFQAQFHLTPRAYMTDLRMARARALLATDRPITEIAFDCGYADSNYFSQVFRRHAGMSPQQYRRETRK